jgi:uncharacterized protein YdaU (DUF1376 family)
MKERAPAFQFYPRQFAGDDQVMGMDLEAIGAHILLMCAAAASPEQCRIDADEYAIRMRLRNPSDARWQGIKKQLLAGAWKVSEDGKWWIQVGLQRTFQKQKDFSDSQRDKAKARWRRNDAESTPDGCRTAAEPMPEGMPKVCSSSSSSSSKDKINTFCAGLVAAPPQPDLLRTPEAETLEASKPVAALPTNRKDKFYRVTESQVVQWKELYPAVDVMQELRNMRGWLDANPRNRKTADGVPRFVNNWLRKAQNAAPRVNGSKPNCVASVAKLPSDYVPVGLEPPAPDAKAQAALAEWDRRSQVSEGTRDY